MTQQDKDLLIKDLCARLPYGVKCDVDGDIMEIIGIDYREDGRTIFDFGISINDYPVELYVDEFKPYLFPTPSMTKEQRKEYFDICRQDWIDNKSKNIGEIEVLSKGVDWLNEHHFDFRNLIERGLAIDCTNLNIY